MTTAQAAAGRAPEERRTLEDALRIATDIVDLSDENRHAVDVDHYTLAAGFLILAQDMAAMLDAARKATHFCGWCERANNNSRLGLVALPIDEIREHTVHCEHNPVVQRCDALRDLLLETLTAARVGYVPDRLDQIERLAKEGA